MCKSTKIEDCSYIRLANLKHVNVEAAKKCLEKVQKIDTMFLFMPGNALFPSRNFRDQEGNVHAHKVQKRKWKNRQVESQMLKYAPIISLCKDKHVNKIVIVPCYLRNQHRTCSATYELCMAQNLRESFPLSYSKRIISLAMRKLGKLITAEGIKQETISLKKFEYICVGEERRNLSNKEMICKILGEDDVHLSAGPQRLLGEYLSHIARRERAATARPMGQR